MTVYLLMGNEALGLGALHAGVNFAAGYPGTPSTEVLETVAAHNDGSVHVEWSTNEKAALEAAAGASMAGARALVTMKQVGLNVASDPLMTLSYLGCKGGLVLVVADDPGPISSQTEQDTRAFGRFAKVPVLDPVSAGECYGVVQDAFEISERYDTPVIVRPTTRVCHACGTVKTRGGVADCAPMETFKHPKMAQDDPYWEQFRHEASGFERDAARWVVFPKTSRANHARAEARAAQIARDFANGWHPNRIEMGGQHHARGTMAFAQRARGAAAAHAAAPAGAAAAGLGAALGAAAQGAQPFPFGIAAGGVSYHYVKEALEMAGLDVPLLKVGMPYPFPETLGLEFLDACEEVLVVEELDPVIERELVFLCGRRGWRRAVHGKLDGTFPYEGEQSVEAVLAALERLAGAGNGEGAGGTGNVEGATGAGDGEGDGAGDSESVGNAGGGEGGGAKAALASAGAISPFTKDGGAGENANAGAPGERDGTGAAAADGLVPKPELPARPPVLCAGCPHRASFLAVKRAVGTRKAAFCGDIGCYTLGNAAPLEMVDTCVCMGAGFTVPQGISCADPETLAFGFVGDSTFFASGITGVVNAVYNRHKLVLCVLDNSTTAMTGQQPHPGTGRTLMDVGGGKAAGGAAAGGGTAGGKAGGGAASGASNAAASGAPDGAALSIPRVLEALDVPCTLVDPFDQAGAMQAVKDAVGAVDAGGGVRALVFKAPCIYVDPERRAPLFIDQDACVRCHACIDRLGCPALFLEGGAVKIDAALCNGCGLCPQVCPTGAIEAPDAGDAQSDARDAQPNAAAGAKGAGKANTGADTNAGADADVPAGANAGAPASEGAEGGGHAHA